MKEPIIHSHITDGLPDDHPLRFEQVHCSHCGNLVHAGNNECMATWVEWLDVVTCITCADIPTYLQGDGCWIDRRGVK